MIARRFHGPGARARTGGPVHWGWFAIGLGILLILTRAPFLLFPHETLAFYGRLYATDVQARAWSAVYLALAVLCAWGAMPLRDTAQTVIAAFGLVFLAFGVWSLAMPSDVRSVIDGFLAFMRESVDAAVLRAIGAFTLAIGTALVFVGVRAL